MPPTIVPRREEICFSLAELQKMRRAGIKEQSRAQRSVEMMIARWNGYHAGLLEAERKRLMRLARQWRVAIESAGPDWQPPEDSGAKGRYFKYLSAHVCQVAAGRQPWDRMRADIEDEMKALARQLAVWPWVRGISGVAELGLAVIVGETGDLGNYANPGKIWKRCGLAVFDGRRQGNPGEGATKGDWIRHGYNRQRRAEIWACLSDTMFRQQWRGDRDEDGKDPKETGKPVAVPAHAVGPYGEVYAARKEWNLMRGWMPKHADNEGRCYMSKRFLLHFWREWRRSATAALEPTATMPTAVAIPDAAE